MNERGLPRSLDCKTVVFFANASDGPYSNERSGASVKTARENGARRGSRASHSRVTLTALPAFRKRPKTTVLQSTRSSASDLLALHALVFFLSDLFLPFGHLPRMLFWIGPVGFFCFRFFLKQLTQSGYARNNPVSRFPT